MTDAQTLVFLGWVGLMLLTWLLTPRNGTDGSAVRRRLAGPG